MDSLKSSAKSLPLKISVSSTYFSIKVHSISLWVSYAVS